MRIQKKRILRFKLQNIIFSLFVILNTNNTKAESFVDIDNTHPHYQAIHYLESNEIIKGVTQNGSPYFLPLAKINRAEALKILMIAGNIEIENNDDFIFPDVKPQKWFAPYINTAANLDIVSGFGDGKFYPAAQVSRAQFLKMLIETFEFELPPEPEEVGKWYDPYFEVAQEYRIISQKELDPNESINRDQAAEMTFRTIWIAENNFNKKYIYTGYGKASYYNEGFAGRTTASGEIYDPFAMTAAHRTLPFGTKLKVFLDENPENFAVVRITDRGPYHHNRVIDLSEKAFSLLAPISRGVIDIRFEVFSEPIDTKPSIPETIRPQLSTELKNEKIPEVIVSSITKATTRKTPEKVKRSPTQPLFEETIQMLPHDFFPNLTLRKKFPQTIVVGSVLNIMGRAKESGNNNITIFIESLKNGKQEHFTGTVSEKNFKLPIHFLETGEFQIGMIFDGETKSRIAKVKVVDLTRERKFNASSIQFQSNISINVIPEEEKVLFTILVLKKS